mgnify:CR=1 FL=1
MTVYNIEDLKKLMSSAKLQKRKEIASYFASVAAQESQKAQKIDFGDLLDKNDKKRILFIIKESLGDIFLCTALFRSIRNRYPRPEWAFYVATKPECKEILDGNPYLDKWIQYQPIMDNHLIMTGRVDHNGYFNVCYDVAAHTQKLGDYYHDIGSDKIDLPLKYETN